MGGSRKPKQLWHWVVVGSKGGALGTVAGEMHQELTKHWVSDENEMRLLGSTVAKGKS